MSLNIGELVGYLDLDDAPFDKKLDEAGDKLQDFGHKGAKIVAASGIAIGTALGAGILGGMGREASNDKLAAQLGINDPKWAAELGGVAGDLYANAYGDSLDTVNEALRGVLQSGAVFEDESTAQIQAVTAKVLDLATAFDEDLGGVTQAVGQMVRNGLAKDADEALDLITRGMQQGVNKSEDLLDTLNEYPTVLRDAGLSGADAMGLLSQGLNAGARDADTVADALKEFAIRAQDGSTTSAAGFKAIGLNAKQMTADVAGGGPKARAALDQVLDGLRKMKDPAERNAAAVALFGTKAEDLGDALFKLDLDTAADGLGTVEGAAAKMGTTLNDNATTNIESFKRKAQQAFVDTIGGKALPAVNDIAIALNTGFGPALHAVGDALSEVNDFLGDHQTTAKVLAGTLTALVVVTTLHAAVLAVTAAGGMAAWLKQTRLISTATKAWAAVQWLLNAALAANPIALIVIGLAALAAGLVYAYKHSETFRDIVSGAFRFVLKAIDLLLLYWQTLLRALGKVPGFGWADDAAAAIGRARNKLDGFSDSLKKIPTHKFIDIIVRAPSAKELKGVGGTKGLTLEGARAGGGPVAPYGRYLVGERGPEVIELGGVGGNVIPNHQLAGRVRGGDGAEAMRLHPDDLRALRTGTRDLHFHTAPGPAGEQVVEDVVFATRIGRL